MSATNGKIAQKIEGFMITMEQLVKDIRSTSTSSFEGTMTASKVTDVKNKLDAVEDRIDEMHILMQEACATSSDADVANRSGGGGGK